MFGWLTGKKPPPEWSAVGARIRDLLTNDRGGWQLSRGHGVRHATGLEVNTYRPKHPAHVLEVDNRVVPVPAWEGRELRRLADELCDALIAEQDSANNRAVLARLGATRPPAFTDNARALAWAVLRGQEEAAYALADEVIEYANRPQTPDKKESA